MIYKGGKRLSLLVAAFSLAILPGLTDLKATAQEMVDSERLAHRQQVLKYANGRFLAYVPSSSDQANQDALKGLQTLQEALRKRTTIDPDKEIIALNLEADTLIPFKFIYWPIASGDQTISEKAQQKIQRFINSGGIIMFDVVDRDNKPVQQRVSEILGNVSLGSLGPLTGKHALNITHYRIQAFPTRNKQAILTGAFNVDPIIVQIPDSRKTESISSVIMGRRQWAKAWSGRGVYPEDKEYALKSGINVVMYVFAGKYKPDQMRIKETLKKVQK